MDPAQVLEAEVIARHSVINETIARGDSPVQRFYAGAVVFITGGSGFLGKQLIEKLFRSCKIDKMYILLRPKRQMSIELRIKDIMSDPLYEYLHKHQPDFVKKCVPVVGDITEVRLGISDDAWKVIIEEVNVIIHSAATINFMETLKIATLTNVRGTREVVHLARSSKNLKSMVYISTAYSHATSYRTGQDIFEQFYPTPLPPDLLIKMAENLDETLIDTITTDLLREWPNTYSFTKAVAEELIRTQTSDLPVCIVRPSIVMGAVRETPGWTDKTTINGPIGIIIGACLGGLHVGYGTSSIHLDMVPIDVVNNAVIAALYTTALRYNKGETDIKIYTVTTNRNPMTLGQLHHFLENDARCLQSPRLIWYGYLIMTNSKILLYLLVWLLHYIPGYLVDGILVLLGRKPKVIRLFERAYKHNKVYYYYTNNEWHFQDSNLVEMYWNLTTSDRIIYNCDVSFIDNKEFLCMCCIGARKYIIKDGLQNTDYAVRKQNWLRIANVIYLSIYAYFLWKLFLCLIDFSQVLISTFIY